MYFERPFCVCIIIRTDTESVVPTKRQDLEKMHLVRPRNLIQSYIPTICFNPLYNLTRLVLLTLSIFEILYVWLYQFSGAVYLFF